MSAFGPMTGRRRMRDDARPRPPEDAIPSGGGEPKGRLAIPVFSNSRAKRGATPGHRGIAFMEVCGAWYALWPYMNAMPHPSPVMAVRRIFALSLQGDKLQVYTNPVEGHTFKSLCYFDGKLLAPVLDEVKSRRMPG
jgi:hypothetical protein